jgi:deoxyadenosine/deoxycytidine kinase
MIKTQTIVIPYNYIAIEGNIGAGKTTFATRFSTEFNAKLILERFEDNSFLPKFYAQPDIYAFPLEMSFLADRYQQLKDQLSPLDLFKAFTVSDYFIDKSLIFARNNLKADEFNLYSRLFSIISSSLPKPELIIYLYATVPQLLNNINKRGRHYEMSIQSAYLENIQSGYLSHFRTISGIPILIVETGDMDFVEREGDYNKLVSLLSRSYDPGIHRIRV